MQFQGGLPPDKPLFECRHIPLSDFGLLASGTTPKWPASALQNIFSVGRVPLMPGKLVALFEANHYERSCVSFV